MSVQTSRSASWSSGFVLVPNLLSPAEIAHACELLEPLLSARLLPGCERPNNTLRPLRWSDPLVEVFLGEAEKVTRIAGAIGADDLRWISGYVSTKDPNSPPLWWHQDWWCWDHPISFRSAAPQVAVLTYLSDTEEANGALRVLPGSHWASGPLHAQLPEAHATAAIESGLDNPSMRNQDGQVTLNLRAGDAVATDYRLLHGTHANTTNRPRHAVLLSFTPNWAGLPEDLRAHLIQHPALPSAEEGDRLPAWFRTLAPTHDGDRVSIPLNRVAPSHFNVSGS